MLLISSGLADCLGGLILITSVPCSEHEVFWSTMFDPFQVRPLSSTEASAYRLRFKINESRAVELEAHGHDNAAVMVGRLICWAELDCALAIFQGDLHCARLDDAEHVEEERRVETDS